MKDQPFKRGAFPTDKSRLESYKYPTYQHYYKSQRSQNKMAESPTKKDISSDKNITDTGSDHQVAPPLLHKKSTKTNLKNQLQSLKLQVQKIMERKQGILKSTVQKRLFPSLSESQLRMTPKKTRSKEETDDNQSITSEKIIDEPIKKLQLKAATENYDHGKYMQLENELLKTELKNLKNKYVSKKQELNEKCQALEKKISFLQSSLYNSEEALVAEINLLKANIKQLEEEKKSFRTPDKAERCQENSPLNNIEQQRKIQQLNQSIEILKKELSLKDVSLQSKQIEIENLNLTISSLQVQIEDIKTTKTENTPVQNIQDNKNQLNYQQKINQLNVQIEQLRKINRVNSQLLEEKQIEISEFEAKIIALKEKIFADNNTKVDAWQSKLEEIKQKFSKQLSKSQEQYEKIASENNRLVEQNKQLLKKNEIGPLGQNQNNIIEELQNQIKEEKMNTQNIEQKYVKMLEATQKKYEQKIKLINLEFQSKILARKQSKSIKDSTSNIGDIVPNRQIKKWKLEYKHLKEKFQNHLKEQSQKNKQFKIYYKNYRQYKDKAQILTKQYQILEEKSEIYLNTLASKQKQLLQQQVEIRKLKTQDKQEQLRYTQELSDLQEKCNKLEEKIKEQEAKYQKESIYRRQLQQKILSEGMTEDSIKQAMDRMKKRLIEQDQKQSKNVKQMKNKELLNTKLKKELRQVMENMEKQINQQKNKEIEYIMENYIKKQFTSFSEWKSKAVAENNILKQSNNNFIKQLDQLKNKLDSKEQEISSMRNELNSFIHSYNLKNIQVNEIIDQKQQLISHYINQLEELKIIKDSAEGILRDEIMEKNQEITNLRMQIATQSMKSFEFRTFNSTFDDILKSQIEENKKLREEITKKTEEIFKLRDNYGALRSQFQNIKAQIQINKLKFMSQMKNMEVNFQVDSQKIRNNLDMSERKSNLLEQKLKLVIQESHKKDSFIQNYIISKKLVQGDKDIVTKFMKQYEITIGSSDIVERLANETKQIQQLNNYNRILLKQISALKDKIVDYEAIDEGQVSIYNSKYSKKSHQSSEINDEKVDQVMPDVENITKKLKKTPESKLKKAESVQIYMQDYKQTQ